MRRTFVLLKCLSYYANFPLASGNIILFLSFIVTVIWKKNSYSKAIVHPCHMTCPLFTTALEVYFSGLFSTATNAQLTRTINKSAIIFGSCAEQPTEVYFQCSRKQRACHVTRMDDSFAVTILLPDNLNNKTKK